jgi:type IV pilus assembly protein PilC
MVKHRFAWQGIDCQGAIQNGVVHAHNHAEVTHELKQLRIRATRIQRQFDLPSWLSFQSQSRVSARDLTQFTRQLATLLQAGVPLLQAFDILERSESNATLKTIIHDLRTQIEGGAALNQALRQHQVFEMHCIATWWPWVSWLAC